MPFERALRWWPKDFCVLVFWPDAWHDLGRTKIGSLCSIDPRLAADAAAFAPLEEWGVLCVPPSLALCLILVLINEGLHLIFPLHRITMDLLAAIAPAIQAHLALAFGISPIHLRLQAMADLAILVLWICFVKFVVYRSNVLQGFVGLLGLFCWVC